MTKESKVGTPVRTTDCPPLTWPGKRILSIGKHRGNGPVVNPHGILNN